MTRFLIACCAWLCLPSLASATTLSRLTTWTNGQVLTHSALNSEFDNLVNDYNGSISAANLAAGSVGSSEIIEDDDYTMNNLILSTTAPDVRWNPTSGDSFHAGAEYSANTGSIWFLSNVTDGQHYIRIRNDHKMELPQYLNCVRLSTAADGKVICSGSDTVTTSSRVVRTAGDVTTTSTSLTDLTGASITMTTGANPVLLSFAGGCSQDSAGSSIRMNFDVDGTALLGSAGIEIDPPSANDPENCSFAALSAALTAGSHTFKVRWFVSGGTGTIQGDSTNSYVFSAVEVTD